jgi:transposase
MVLMDVSPFLPLRGGLLVERVEHTATTLTVAVASTSLVACCPLCQEPSEHLHGHYQRTVVDLPCSGRQVTLLLTVRKFICLNLACPRVIFAERLPDLVQPRVRSTMRLLASLRSLGFATSGEAGSRLATQMGMQVSPSTLLRRIKDASLPLPTHTVTKVGLDDFALRRGLTYGTIIVDLETHRVLDLLPDRTSATVISWLQAHPEIELISRDRGKDYAIAARLGAPQAVQVVDRWHLLHNLSEALSLLLARHRDEIKHTSRGLAPPPGEPMPPPEEQGASEFTPPAAVPLVLEHAYRAPKIQALQDARRAQRLACYEQVVTLRNQHVTPDEIAERLGISTRTIARWLAQDGIPLASQRRRRASLLDPYEAYVLCQWQAGHHNGAQIWRELVAQGYTGSPRSLYHFLARLPAPPPKPKPIPRKPRRVKLPPGPYDHLSTKQAVWLFVRPLAQLTQAEQETCAFLRQVHPHLETAYHLAQDFVALFAERNPDRLDRWIKRARKSHIPDLVRFGTGLTQDSVAVRASLVLPYSQGVVEGHVNRLKLIKRMMYGRASFPLLRQRVLSVA